MGKDLRRVRFFADAGAAGGAAGGGSGAGGAGAGAAAAGAAASTPVPGLADAQGVLADNWLQHEKIDPSLRTNKTLGGIKSVAELAGQVVNLEKVLGKKRAVIPENDQDKPGMDAYMHAVGWPEKVEGYPEIQVLEGTPKELPRDPELEKAWRSWAHEGRLTTAQYQLLTKKIQEWNLAEYKNEQAAAAQAHETAKADFRTRHGAKADYEIQLANTAAAAFADQPLLERLKTKGYLDDPDFLQYSANVGHAVAPDRLHASSSGGIDKGSLQRQIAEMETSPEYRDPKHTRHAYVTNEVLRLREQLLNAR